MATPAMQPVAAKASTAKALTINDLPVKIHEKIFGLWRGTPFTRSLRKTILSCSLTQRSWRRLAQQCWFYGLIVGRKDFENNKVDKFYLDDTQAEDIPAAANRDILQYVRMLAIGPLPSDSPTTTTADDDNDDNGDWMHSARFNAFIDRCGAGVKWLTVYQLRFKDYSHFVRFVRRFSVLQKLDFHACSWTEAEDPMEVDIDGSYPPIANLQSVALSDCNAAVTAKVGAWLTSETTCELPTLGWQVWLNHDVDGASNLFRALGSSLTRLVIGGIFARPRVVSPDSVYAASPWKQLGHADEIQFPDFSHNKKLGEVNVTLSISPTHVPPNVLSQLFSTINSRHLRLISIQFTVKSPWSPHYLDWEAFGQTLSSGKFPCLRRLTISIDAEPIVWYLLRGNPDLVDIVNMLRLKLVNVRVVVENTKESDIWSSAEWAVVMV